MKRLISLSQLILASKIKDVVDNCWVELEDSVEIIHWQLSSPWNLRFDCLLYQHESYLIDLQVLAKLKLFFCKEWQPDRAWLWFYLLLNFNTPPFWITALMIFFCFSRRSDLVFQNSFFDDSSDKPFMVKGGGKSSKWSEQSCHFFFLFGLLPISFIKLV